MVVENKEPLWPSGCMSLDTSLLCMDSTLAPSLIPSSTLMSEVCCRPTRGLFMMTEWCLLGEPPPGTSSMMGASLLMFPLLWLMSKVEYPFSFLGMPSMETTTNHTSNSTISNTWRSSSATHLLPFSTILTPWRRQTWPSWDLALFLISYSEYSSFSCTCTRTHLLRVEDEMCALVNLRSCSNLSPALVHAVDLLLLNHISRKTHTTFCSTAKPPWVFVEIYIMTLALSQTTACFLLLHVLMSLWILAQLDNMTTTVLSVMTQELLSTAELSQRSPVLLSGTP